MNKIYLIRKGRLCSFFRVVLLVILLGISVESMGQINISALGTAFTQNFDGIGNTALANLPTGFKIGTDWATGTIATTVVYGTTGVGIITGASPGGAVNWANGIAASSTERAIGFLSSGTYTSPKSIILKITNTSGITISSLDISFDYEKYRSGSRAFDWTFFHGNTSTAATSNVSGDQSYVADANNTTVSNPPLSIAKSFSLTGLSIATGTDYYLRWTYTGLAGSTNAQGLCIDNFNLVGFSAICVPPTLTSASLSATICSSGSAVINMTGLVANSAGNKIDYTINGVAQPQITSVNADATGNASFTTSALTTANNGQILQITGITNGTCNTTFTQNVTLVVAVLPAAPIAPTVTGTNPSCGATSLNIIVPAGGETYYWQGTSALGISTASPTSATYTVPTTGTYYVRAQNNTTFCWSAASSLLVTINTSPTISVQPINQTVSTPTSATFSVTITNPPVTYQWQVNTGSGFADIVGAISSSYLTGATATSMNGYTYKCIITGALGCGNITTNTATLTVNSTPCISANFDGSTTVPAGWTGISANDAVSSHYLSAPNCRGLGIGKDLITPLATNPISISFYVDASGSGGQIGTLEYNISGGAWTSITTFSATTAGAILTFPLTSSPDLSVTANVAFRISSAANTIYIDDVNVYCGSGACTLPTTIGSFLPITGPAGTLVTITGSGFVPTSTVKFGTKVSLFVTYVSATTLIAEVPAGVSATSAISTSNAAGCYSNGFGTFTLINATGSCGYTDLIISEIYDAVSGNNHYIEIYNGTSSTINLDAPDYELNVLSKPSGATTTWDISGTIAPGQVIVYYGGANGLSLATGTQSNAGTGYNDGFDEIRLLKGGVILDRVVAPDELGYTIKRIGAILGPNATYTAAEWTVLSNEATTDIGLYTAGTTSLSITTQPIDQTCSFSMSVVGAGSPTTYQWKYYNTITNTWDPLNNGIATALAPAVLAGSTSATLTITGDIASLYNYQFYCEIGKPGCTKASDAAQFLYNTKAYYKSNVAAGNWTTPGSWLMSDDDFTYVPTCTFPISANSDFVKILSGHKIILNTNGYLFNEDKLDIQVGGELEIGTGAQMQFQNNQVGADLLVNGILTDRSSTGNGTYFINGSTWSFGANGTLVKTNTASVNAYQVAYDGGAITMPATASWIFRYNGDGNIAVASIGVYYPNLTYESVVAGNRDALNFGEKFSGAGGFATIKGNLDIGGTGIGTVTVYNENTNAQAMLINGNLTIRPGSTLNNGAATNGTGFEVKGNITVDGTFNVNTNNAGTLILSDTTLLTTIGGSNAVANNMNIQNCIIKNTTGVIVNKDFNIFGTNTFGANAKLDFGTGVISLKSTPTATANVAAVPATAAITYSGAGRYNIERYLQSIKSWRLLATPVDIASSPSITNSWREGVAGVPSALTSTGYGTQITGPGAIGASGVDQNTQRGSVKSYDMASNNFIEVTNTANPIADTAGYFVFVRGDRAVGVGGVTSTTNLRIKGKLRIGDQTINVSAGKFQSFGNPYASRIDVSKITKNGITDAIIIWDPFSAGAYNVGVYKTYIHIGPDYVRVPNDGTTRNFIESGEAVFIQNNTVVNDNITIHELDKASGSANVSRVGNLQNGANVAEPTLDINLFAKDLNGSMYLADGIKLNFDNNYSNGIDNDDVRKILNTADNLYIKNSNAKLVVERRNILQSTDTIFLQLTGTRVATYRFEIAPSLLNNVNLEAFLKDKFLQTETPISFDNIININVDITADAASKVADRFMIVFKQALPLTKFITVHAFTNTDKTNAILWTVSNENKVANYTVERSVNGTDFIAIKNNAALLNNNTAVSYTNNDAQPLQNDNYYRIKMLLLNGNMVYSNIVKVGKINNEIDITISPNPVSDKTIHLQMANQPKGLYNLRLINTIGQIIYEGRVEVTSYLQTLDISLNKNTAVGNYEFIIVNANGEKTIKKVAIVE